MGVSPTAAGTPTPVQPAQQVGLALAESNAASTPTAAAEVAVPAPESVTPSGPSFAPAGTRGSGSGVMTNTQQRDRYSFEGAQGQLLEVRAKRTSGVTLIPQVALLDPSGVDELPPSFPARPELLVERRLASTGEYTIVVSPVQGSGPYTLTWDLDRFGQLSSGGQVNAEITDPDQKDRFHFDGKQGQLLTARMQRTSGVSLQPWIDLVDPTGTSEKTVDGFGQPQVTLEAKLASSGTYMLKVGGRNTGPYVVTLSLR
jgi:hypothetical protein